MATESIPAERVQARLAKAGIECSPSEAESLARYLSLLEQWNRVYNLTGIRERGELLGRHLVESLALAPLIVGKRVADVGTGAGLPGLPLAICRPELEFTLIESRRKKVNFLRHVVATLGLTNTTVWHGRAEDLSTPEPFATVLARAVAPPAELIEIVRPLTAEGSVVLLLTSARLGREIAQAAADFVERPVRPGLPLKSSIVMLERRSAAGR